MRVRTYATLRDLLDFSALDLPLGGACTVGAVLRLLVERYPALGEKLWDDGGHTTGYITVLLNGRSVEYLQGPDTPLTDEDTLALFPPVGGG